MEPWLSGSISDRRHGRVQNHQSNITDQGFHQGGNDHGPVEHCSGTDASVEETISYRQDLWHKLTLELQGYEYGSEISVTGSGSLTVNNPGNIATPAILEITPTIGSASITVSGICRDPDSKNDFPVTIKNLVTGKKVVIDGENGLVTQDGALKAGDVDFWEAPILFPGTNKITCSNSNMKMTVKFKPRFM